MDAVLGWNLVLSLPVILAIAWLAGRLLGVSRSLGEPVVVKTQRPPIAEAVDRDLLVLAGLGGLVGVRSVMLLGTQGGPPFTGDTSLFQFFGYFELFCATVLIPRVIVAILRDGLN
jgi:hypothetical protein